MSWSGRKVLPDARGWLETLPDGREWLGGPPGCPGVVGKPAGCLGVVERLSRMFERPPGCPGLVGKPSRMSRRPSQMSGSGRKALPDDRDWYGDILDVREWLKSYPECPIVVGRPSRMSESGRETLQVVRE